MFRLPCTPSLRKGPQVKILFHQVLPNNFKLTSFNKKIERIEDVLRSAHILRFTKDKVKYRGNAVAVSKTLAVTSLHGYVGVGTIVTLRSKNGMSRNARVVFISFEPEARDLAFVQLESGHFDYYTSVSVTPVYLLDKVFIAGLKVNSRDEVNNCAFETSVNVIEEGEGNAFFQSSYVSFDSLSGPGVVVKQINRCFKVIGVHVASHEETVRAPEVLPLRIGAEAEPKTATKKGRKTTAKISQASKQEVDVDYESTVVAMASLSSNIHGHHSYTMVCEIGRVEDAVTFLRRHKAI